MLKGFGRYILLNPLRQFNTPPRPARVAETQNIVLSMTMTKRQQLGQAHSALKWGLTGAALGLFLCLVSTPVLGGMLVIGGLFSAIYGLHRFGRTGNSP
jgi:hypothetical protein